MFKSNAQPSSLLQIELQDVLDRQSEMQESLSELRSQLKSVAKDNERMREMLAAMAEHNEVSIAPGDEF